MSTDLWTMDQLTQRVAASLHARQSTTVGEEHPRSGDASLDMKRAPSPSTRADAGQLNGRVREVPDARTIRWYQTTGIVDRPVAMRGRTALYGRRHLLQLLAIKRLQARGLSLAGIQAELAGASDPMLERVAGEPEPAEDGTPGARSSPDPGSTVPDEAEPSGRTRFWATPPNGSIATAGAPAADPSLDRTVDVVGIRIADGLTLLFDQPGRPISADDATAIRATAGPLVQLVRQRDLLGGANPSAAPGSEPYDHSERGKDNP